MFKRIKNPEPLGYKDVSAFRLFGFYSFLEHVLALPVNVTYFYTQTNFIEK